MKDLKEFYREFGKIGARSDLDLFRKKQIQYTNQIVLVFGLSCLPYIFIMLFLGYYLAALLIGLCVVSFFIGPILNKYGHHDIGTVLYIMLVYLFLVVFTFLFGTESEIQHVLVTAAFLPGAIFFNSRRTIILSLAGLSIVLYILIELILSESAGYYHREDSLFFYLFIPFRAVSILFPIMHLNSNRRMSERTLIDAKQKLEEAYKLLQNKAQERKIKIQTQSNYLNHILSNLPVLLFATDNQGYLQLVMGEGLDDTGLPEIIKEGVSIKDLNGILPYEVINKLDDKNDTGIIQVEFLFQKVHFKIAITKPVQGEPGSLIGIVYNIDAEKKSQEELLRLTDILNQSTDYIASLEPDGKPIYFNNALKDLIQKDLKDVSNMSQLHPSETLGRIRDAFDKQLYNDIWQGDSLLLDSNQKLIPVSQIIIRHRDENDRIVRYSTVMRNISEQKLIQERMAMYAVELEKSNQDLKHFAYITSHDLKEPIRNIATHVQLLTKLIEGNQSETISEYSTFITKNAVRLSNLVSSLLKYTNLEKMDAEVSDSVSIGELIQDIIESHKLMIEENNVSIKYSGIESVVTSKYYLMILLQNLIENGIKYNKSVFKTIHIQSRVQGEEIIFSIEDNGIGIPEESKSGVFLMFKRLHSYDEYEGHGIGLAACKRIVEKLGGKIWFESTLEVGSVFYFTIPIKGAA